MTVSQGVFRGGVSFDVSQVPHRRAAAAALLSIAVLATTLRGQVSVYPASVALHLPESSQQLVVSTSVEGHSVDRTREVRFEVADPDVVTVDSRGRVRPRRDGETHVIIHDGKQLIEVPVEVTGVTNPPPVSFKEQVIPILSKAGCNSGGCHGKKEGQDGFKLSVFGVDPLADYEQIALHGRGRRVFSATPERSLFLQKSTGEVAHGGGKKIDVGSPWFRRIVRWMSEGTPLDSDAVAPATEIAVEPREIVLSFGASFQLCVTATDAKGRRYCVTPEAEYESNSPAHANVDRDGLITTGTAPGEAAILVRYMGRVAVCRVTLPQPGVTFERPPEHNFVDTLVWNKLELLGIAPSELADDAMFLRRVYLDTIGTLPTSQEARAFLADTAPEKRRRLIDALLQRDEYADYWAMRWADLLRVDTLKISAQGAVAMSRWLRRQFVENTRYDDFVRAILTARGASFAEGPVSFYQALGDPESLARSVSQLFLGVRIECAQCHNHPSERWSPDDYYAFAGFFTGIGRKGTPSGGQTIFPNGGADVKNPLTKVAVPTAALGAQPIDLSSLSDRRAALADWMAAEGNPYFSRLIANRLWAHYFGRGLVEPLDDLRTTNPPTNEPLLDALAAHLGRSDFDLKEFTRTLLNSRVYQLSSVPNETNVRDEQSFSHALYKPMPAEVLLDAISQATGVPTEFSGWPLGVRAIEVWDNRVPSYFFKIFGRPSRLTVCECERGNEPSISQALHLMNSPEVTAKIGHYKGRARELAASGRSPGEIIRELSLSTLARPPKPQELTLLLKAYEVSRDTRRATEDVLWTFLNMKRFVYIH